MRHSCLVIIIIRCFGHCFVGVMIFNYRPIIAIAFPKYAKSSVKRLYSLLVSAIIFLSLINNITNKLLWYIIPLIWSWPSEIKLKLHPGAKKILYSSIVLFFANKIETVSISFIQITCLTAVTKSLLLAFIFENNFLLLQKCIKRTSLRNRCLYPIFVAIF